MELTLEDIETLKWIFKGFDMAETMFLQFEDKKDIIYEMFDKVHHLKEHMIMD